MGHPLTGKREKFLHGSIETLSPNKQHFLTHDLAAFGNTSGREGGL